MSISSNAVNSVKGEIHNVLSIMRMSRRWASDERFKREMPLHHETPLIRSFKTLLNHLQYFDDLTDVDAVTFLSPFLHVVQSTDTSGPLTGLALQSINKFLIYGFLKTDTPRCAEGANAIARAVNRCRFESSSAADDEATLMSLLEVTENVVRSDAGAHLTDDNVWQLIKSCHRLAHMEHASPLLRKSAESTLTNILLALFSALPSTTSVNDTPAATASAVFAAEGSLQAVGDGVPTQLPPAALRAATTPHGVPVLTRILRWLARMTDMKRVIDISAAKPASSKPVAGAAFDPWDDAALVATDEVMGAAAGGVDDDVARRALCTSSLRHINVALETAGPSMGHHPELVRAVQVDVCKHLVSNSRTQDLLVLSLTLRVVFNLFIALKSHLKVQLEVFFTSVHLHLADAKSLSPEHKEQALESLLEFCREPMLMLDLYINYDCDVMCTNLFETLCSSCCKNAVPASGPLNSLHITALEGVLAVVDNIAQGCAAYAQSGGSSASDGLDGSQADTPSAQGSDALSLRERKALKRKMQLAAARFNGDSNPSKSRWIPYVQELGLLPDPVSPSDVARFLRECSGLDLALVGDYLSEPPEEKYKLNTAVREAYIQGFNFTNMRVDEALRVFLEEFRLPGESQKIERLMESLSAHLHAQSPGPTATPDSIFVLSYAVIMLNTDAHNKEVRRKMSRETFRSQLRGVNDGKDFPAEYVDEIYDSIHARQIRLKMDVNTLSASSNSMDHGAAVGSAWEGVLARAGAVSAFTAGGGQASAEYHRDMFQLIADSSLSALSYVWANSSDPAVLLRVLRGFFQCASISAHFGMAETLNGIVMSLSRYWLKSTPVVMDRFSPSPGVLALPSAFLALEAPSRDERSRPSSRSRADSIASSFDDSVLEYGQASLSEGGASFSMVSPSNAAGGLQTVSPLPPAPPAAHHDPAAAAAASAVSRADSAGLSSSILSTDGDMAASAGRQPSRRRSRPALPGPPMPAGDAWRLQHSDALPAADSLEVYRCLLTLRAVLLLARGHAPHIKEAWRSIVEVAAFMNSSGALPVGFIESDDLPAPDGAPLPSLLHCDTRVADAKQHNTSRARALLSTEDDPVPAGFELRPSVAGAKSAAAGSAEGRSRSDTADSTHGPQASKRGVWGMFSTLILGEDEDSSWSPSDVLVRSLRFEAWRCGFSEMFTRDTARLSDSGLQDISKACMLLADSHALSRREAVRCCFGGELVAALVIWSGARWPAVWPAAVQHWEKLLRFHPSPAAVASRLADCAQLPQTDDLDWSDAEDDEETAASVFEGHLSPRPDAVPQHAATAKLSAGAAHQIAHVLERSVVNALRCVVRLLSIQASCRGEEASQRSLQDILQPAVQLIEQLDDDVASLVAPRVAAGLGILFPMLRGAAVPDAMWARLSAALVSTRRNFFALPSIIEAQRALLSGASVCITPWALAVADCMQVCKGLLPEHAVAGTAAAVAFLAAPAQSQQQPYYNALAAYAVGRPMSQLHTAVVKHTLQLLRVAAAGLSRLEGPTALRGAPSDLEFVSRISASWRLASGHVTLPTAFSGVQWHEPAAEIRSSASSPSGVSSTSTGGVQHAPWTIPESAWAFLAAQFAAVLCSIWCGQHTAGGNGEQAQPIRLPATVQPLAVQECIAALTEALSEFPAATPTASSPEAELELYSSVWTAVLADTLLPLVKDTQMHMCVLDASMAAHLRMELVAILVRTYLRVAVTAASASAGGSLPPAFAALWSDVLSALIDDVQLGGKGAPPRPRSGTDSERGSGWQSLLADNAHEALKNIVLVGTSQGWLRTAAGGGGAEQDPVPQQLGVFAHTPLSPADHSHEEEDLWTITVERLSQDAPSALQALAQVLPPGAIPGMEPVGIPPATTARAASDMAAAGPASSGPALTETAAVTSAAAAAAELGANTPDETPPSASSPTSGVEGLPSEAEEGSAAEASDQDSAAGNSPASMGSQQDASTQAGATGSPTSAAGASPEADTVPEGEADVDTEEATPMGLPRLRTNKSEDDWVAKGIVHPEQGEQGGGADPPVGGAASVAAATGQQPVHPPPSSVINVQEVVPPQPASQQSAPPPAKAKAAAGGGGFFALLFGEDSESEEEDVQALAGED